MIEELLTDGDPAQRTAHQSGSTVERQFSVSLFDTGRALFGGILAFMALDNLRNLEGRIEYAEAKGAPAADRTVPGASGGLLAGGIGVAIWRLPALSAAAIAGFFASVTPVMHDFWNAEDPDEQQQELVHFLKNAALLGAGLSFLHLARREE